MIHDITLWLRETDYVILDFITLSLVLLAAFMTVRMRDLLASSIIFGVFSLLMAIAYLLFDAPDVALTEAAVGAGISTILFIGTLSFTGRVQKRTHIMKRIAAMIATGVVVGSLIISAQDLPAYADGEAPIHQHVAPYYLENTQEDIGIQNFVTAILASYRGFDTMGEVGVIFVAGLAITALLMNVPLTRKTEPRAPVAPSVLAEKQSTTPAPAKPPAKAPAKKSAAQTAAQKAARKKTAISKRTRTTPAKGGRK
ncbi:MAG: DUF4040 domain-containing protein [Alphaproteobacteria bacterium]|nr:DUF4040 domain-containing protein [Alphaproteobacteria bacterium]